MSSKWIEVPSANAPAAEVARQALAARVAKIERMLPLAALEVFCPLMSDKPKALGRSLRRIRKAAGHRRLASPL
jgi:hypothetical protein